MQLIVRFLRGTRWRPSLESFVVASWIAALVGVEAAGRHSASDLSDALMLLFLGSVAAATAIVHSVRKLATVQMAMRLVVRASRWLARLHVEFGVDFRGPPTVRGGFPASWRRGLMLLGALSIAIAAGSRWFPSGLRGVLAPRFYLAYLLVLGVIWSASAVAISLIGFLIWAGVRDRFVEAYAGRGVRPARPERLARLAVILALVAAATLLPSWVPLAVIATGVALTTAALALTGPDLTILWRAKKTGGLRACDGRFLLWLHWTCPVLVATDLVLLTRGQVLWTNDPVLALGENPLTLALGSALAWGAAAVAGLAAWHCLRYVRVAELGKTAPAAPATIAAPPESAAARRQEIQDRRGIIRGLEKLFKRAARRTRRGGTGLWIGLQHWFILGLSPDDHGLGRIARECTVMEGIVGPPFHRAISTKARLHYRQMTTALEIDLILVEHGVPFRRLVRVLRMMFEIYDVYGGRQRAEERHFTGLPGIRVIIHDFDLAKSPTHGRTNYPEPDYDQIGRARILHVFKDRGESEIPEEVPSSWEGAPVFSGV